MKLDFNIQTSQKQGLALTAQVQQAIKLLHMTNIEIKEFVEKEFEENPFVETGDQTLEQHFEQAEVSDNKSTDEYLDTPAFTSGTNESKVVTENQFETGDGYLPRSTVSKQYTDYDMINLVKEENKSLYSHCYHFVASLNLRAAEQVIANKLVEALEQTGWITEDLNKIAEALHCNTTNIENVLLKLQDIEPAGIFARNLRECLILQAKDAQLYDENMSVVLDNLHLMASGKFELLRRRSGCTDQEISSVFKIIKSFDPKPGLKFEKIDAPIREPDLIVKEHNNSWIVELNNSNLPSVVVEKGYAQELRKKVNDKSSREFVQNKISEAKWLEKAIEKRNDTMLRVGHEIIKRQKDFLEYGVQSIKPMILKDIAEAVEMHESTISRVTTGSLIQTPQGTIELKAFFSVGLQQDGENEMKSSTSIKHRIKMLIAQENPSKPISDDRIVEVLSDQGVSLARRTVAKYRKLDNIPSSFARKRRNILAGSLV